MNEDQVEKWVLELIEKDTLSEFYTSKLWRRLRKEVLIEYKYECQECKKKGIYTKANHVHHVQYVRRHPRYALSKSYTWRGKEYNNLLPVCKACHETVCHPERLARDKKEDITAERWD